MKPYEIRVGYLMVTSPVTGLYMGGLMVVDGRGLPIEFRYTEPIQPTKLQHILYGNALSRYIKTDVILESLLKSLDTRMQLLVVNDESLLQAEVDWSKRDCEIIRLTETKTKPMAGVGDIEKMSNAEFLIQITPETPPLRVQLPSDGMTGAPNTSSPKSLPDKTADLEAFRNSKAYGLLLEIGRLLDLFEPLNRVEKALGELCQEAGIQKTATA